MAGKDSKENVDSEKVRYEIKIVKCVPFQLCPKCYYIS